MKETELDVNRVSSRAPTSRRSIEPWNGDHLGKRQRQSPQMSLALHCQACSRWATGRRSVENTCDIRFITVRRANTCAQYGLGEQGHPPFHSLYALGRQPITLRRFFTWHICAGALSGTAKVRRYSTQKILRHENLKTTTDIYERLRRQQGSGHEDAGAITQPLELHPKYTPSCTVASYGL